MSEGGRDRPKKSSELRHRQVSWPYGHRPIVMANNNGYKVAAESSVKCSTCPARLMTSELKVGRCGPCVEKDGS